MYVLRHHERHCKRNTSRYESFSWCLKNMFGRNCLNPWGSHAGIYIYKLAMWLQTHSEALTKKIYQFTWLRTFFFTNDNIHLLQHIIPTVLSSFFKIYSHIWLQKSCIPTGSCKVYHQTSMTIVAIRLVTHEKCYVLLGNFFQSPKQNSKKPGPTDCT